METQNSTKKPANKKVWLALIALVAAAALLLGLYFATRKPATAGEKTITVAVVDDPQANAAGQEFTIHTDAEYLRGALEQENLIAGTDSEYGLFVTQVNGIAANDANQEWWCFTRGGEMLETGVDATPIADGEHYEVTLTVGY